MCLVVTTQGLMLSLSSSILEDTPCSCTDYFQSCPCFNYPLGPKYMGMPGINARGALNQAAWSLQWAIYYIVKQHLETVLYKPVCHPGFKVSCARTYPDSFATHVYWVERSCWPSLCHSSPPSLDSVCSTLCSNCRNYLLAKHMILHNFFYDTCNAWYMVLGPWVDLIRCS